ncbi:MAG: HlyD family secretion protein [candidate division BRC1 bacterium ADurb.BinA364]|nr:MAG: HlyD family secretion protein [candidate division BRC1 bacterium ADurb.BinA364]
MIVRVDLVRRRAENAIAVPFFTIVDRENGKAVFVEENNVARERPIQYGAMESGMVEIVSGLEIGDKLIVVGQRDLVDGEPVEEAADLTEMAQAYQKSGKDLASLAMELLHAD